MYAVESTDLWNKFVGTVELLTVVGEVSVGANCYVNSSRISHSDKCYYQHFVEAAEKFKFAANLAYEGAASRLLPKKGVDTAFALAVKAAETFLEGFNFLSEMEDMAPGLSASKTRLEAALSAARAWE